MWNLIYILWILEGEQSKHLLVTTEAHMQSWRGEKELEGSVSLPPLNRLQLVCRQPVSHRGYSMNLWVHYTLSPAPQRSRVKRVGSYWRRHVVVYMPVGHARRSAITLLKPMPEQVLTLWHNMLLLLINNHLLKIENKNRGTANQICEPNKDL